MKKVILAFLLTLMATFSMASKTMTVNGELTGAGSKFSVKVLVGFIHDRELLPIERCQKIAVKNTLDPKVSDITQVEIEGRVIEAHEFDGFVVRE